VSSSVTLENAVRIATISGIVVGGSWAYFNWIKNRAYKPVVSVTCSAVSLVIEGHIILHYTVTIDNQGLARLRVDHSESDLEVAAAVHIFDEAAGLSSIRWEPAGRVEAFLRPGVAGAEPKETVVTEGVVAIPPELGTVTLFRLSPQIKARRRFHRCHHRLRRFREPDTQSPQSDPGGWYWRTETYVTTGQATIPPHPKDDTS
jgi:hypothetical protein